MGKGDKFWHVQLLLRSIPSCPKLSPSLAQSPPWSSTELLMNHTLHNLICISITSGQFWCRQTASNISVGDSITWWQCKICDTLRWLTAEDFLICCQKWLIGVCSHKSTANVHLTLNLIWAFGTFITSYLVLMPKQMLKFRHTEMMAGISNTFHLGRNKLTSFQKITTVPFSLTPIPILPHFTFLPNPPFFLNTQVSQGFLLWPLFFLLIGGNEC